MLSAFQSISLCLKYLLCDLSFSFSYLLFLSASYLSKCIENSDKNIIILNINTLFIFIIKRNLVKLKKS